MDGLPLHAFGQGLLHPKDWKIFLEILKEFQAQKLGYAGVVQRVSAVFMGHPSELARGFNIFLPASSVDCPRREKVVTIDDSDDDALGDADDGGGRGGRPGARRAARRRRHFRINAMCRGPSAKNTPTRAAPCGAASNGYGQSPPSSTRGGREERNRG